ncbi:hypothetical protein IFM89_013153 [Coptis chinensis]|uniref:DUF3741 domain-containing protein n=1 Tax=Coptis chinensis TaxID=261450 RepID=A0A835IPX4_9MAGN|nr:hypothetical protein IFM89_013153 [Coptis chinensis]
MANKLDFAQKLLDDLRLRKEWMTKTQNSSRSNQRPADKYRDFKHPYGELKEMNQRDTIGSTMRDMQKRFSASNRSFDMGESSKELVPVGRAQNYEHIADFSMALAFALKNGGEPRKRHSGSNTLVDFPNHFGRRSMDFGLIDNRLNIETSRHLHPNARVPTLSNLHIKEISKGAQKLNQILKACYNGINFDLYSTDIGKELLRGAMDLEESLKMLVDLQEASEFMVGPQRKQKIKLLEVEDDEDEIEESYQRQMDRPRFSFDRPSRNSLEFVGGVTKNSVNQRQLALYHTETTHLSSEQQASSATKLISHSRSASCGADSRTVTTFSNSKNHSSSSDSQPERGRIPNIIAKLMGLEELPANKHSNIGVQKEQHVKQGARPRNDLQNRWQGSTKDNKQLSITATQKKMMQADKLSLTPETSLVVYADQIRLTQDPFSPQGKVHLKDHKNKEGTNLLSSSKKSVIKISTQEICMAQLHPNTGILMDKQENKRRQENPTPKEQMNKVRSEANKVVLKDEMQKASLAPQSQTYKRPETANAKQENAGRKKDTLQKKKVKARQHIQENSSHPENMFQKSKSQDAKLQKKEREQQKLQNKLQMKKTQRSSMMPNHSSIPSNDSKSLEKKLPLMNHVIPHEKYVTEALTAMRSRISQEGSHQEDLTRIENSTGGKSKIKIAPNEDPAELRPSTRETATNVQIITALIIPVLSKNPVHVPLAQKVGNLEVHKSLNPIEIEEVVIRANNSPCYMAKPPKDQITDEEEPKESRHSRSKSSEEVEVSMNRSKEAQESIQVFKSARDLQKDVGYAPILSTLTQEEQPRMNELETYSPNATIEDNITNISYSLGPSTTPHNEDQMSSNIITTPIKGFDEGRAVGISKSLQQDQHGIMKFEASAKLSQKEKHLKEILVNSQLFLNAAETLFGFDIPEGILHSSGSIYPQEGTNLILDSGYEMMKKKGRRQEFTFRPWTNISLCSVRIRSLDDLVKELHEDLETLKFCTDHESNEDEGANSLHDMLQKDIQNGKPDVNCMWDLGWGEPMFAYLEKEEVIKDVEKHLLNGLLDEFTRDIVHITTLML